MRDKLSVTYLGDSPAPSEQDSLDNRVKTRLRERSMKAENNYPGIQR
ncbi:hypothetical protein SAMN05443574_103327 [Haloarcula vallismortis]|uniref:Uncharacterized protein n=1 Tax=Haloarcula vallismortis TaxID=28442 RepID=A0A1H2TQT8_HALVA|nr:hypothetical protein SAMN05443574_103327 [Haloarcula vallismortis]